MIRLRNKLNWKAIGFLHSYVGMDFRNYDIEYCIHRELDMPLMWSEKYISTVGTTSLIDKLMKDLVLYPFRLSLANNERVHCCKKA